MKQRSEHVQNIREHLRCYVGQYGTMTVDRASALTGIKPGTIRSHLDENGASTPRGPELLAYMSALGPDFTNTVLAGIGQGGAFSLDLNTAPAMEHLGNLQDLARDVTACAADGVIDHQERRKLAPLVRKLATRLAGWGHALRHPVVTIQVFRDNKRAAA